MMVSIYATTEYQAEIKKLIDSVDRLNEVVSVFDMLEVSPESSYHSILIKNGEIGFPLDWYNVAPPYQLPEEIELTKTNLLGIIFGKLNNYEKAYDLLGEANPALFKELDFVNRLQMGLDISTTELSSHYTPHEEYRLMHNNAVLRHYTGEHGNYRLEDNVYFYEEALKTAPNDELKAYSAKQYAQLCIDIGELDVAVHILSDLLSLNLSKPAEIELKNTLCQAWLQQLSYPYDQELLANLKESLWTVLQQYESTGRDVEAGLVLLDAAHIANISESYTESLGYLTRAINIFKEAEMDELVGNSFYRKGTLLYTWAQNSNPQFFKPAIESFQEAIKIFTKEKAPDVFADIHHHLAMLYTDMPAENTKKSIWAGVAVSSFDEALSFYTKDRYPHQYGMICNNYGNAFTKFPKAVLTDNFEKALYYYQKALDVRSPDYPHERAITLLNYLEASWQVGNDPDQFNQERYEDMIQKAHEVKSLVGESEMLEEVRRHLSMLEELSQATPK